MIKHIHTHTQHTHTQTQKEDMGVGAFKCASCGYSSDLWAKFCKKCGTKNSQPPPEDKALMKAGLFEKKKN